MITRRRVVLTLGASVLVDVTGAIAQPATKRVRIGVLSSVSEAASAASGRAVREGLAERGWVEGRNLEFVLRYGNGDPARLDSLAAELVAERVDLIFAGSNQTALAAHKATRSIPIVFAAASDPVGVGLAASLARPGGNATGLSAVGAEMASKRLQILKQAFPSVHHVAVLHNPGNKSSASQLVEIERAAAQMGVRTLPIAVTSERDISIAFDKIAREHVEGLLHTTGGFFSEHRGDIVGRANRARLPAVYDYSVIAEAGGLIAFSIHATEQYRQAADYVDRILRGAKPGDLPIQQPLKYELVINLKTAKALGFSIPQPILVQADRVIE